MELMMYVGNDLIESVSLNFSLIPEPGYVGSFKRNLKQKHRDLLLESGIAPEFLIINLKPATPVRTTANVPMHAFSF